MPKNSFAALAFDRGSVRSRDEDGRLYIAVANISKSNVCGYYGSEIPNCIALGLDPNEMYQLLRDPEELGKAASTFNNLPILSRHAMATAADPMPELVIGSTGTDAVFEAPYLKNSLSIWNAVAIAGIETEQQREISCGYRYDADMRPGTHDGIKYDGRMINIRGSHVAIVETGRAGPDVLIGDAANPLITTEYSNMKASRKAIAVKAALGVFLRPQLALDSAIVDLGALVRGVKAATIAQDKARIVKEVKAKIAGIDTDALAEVIQMAADAEPESPEDGAPKPKTAEDDEDEQREDESDEDYAKRKKAKTKPAEDEDDEDEEKKKKEDKTAMDEAIKSAVVKAESATVARMNAIRTAEKEVAPMIGEVVAQDSASAVYKLALDHAKVDVEGVDPSAYRAMVKMLHKPAETGAVKVKIAQDAAAASDFSKRFPGAKAPGKEY